MSNQAQPDHIVVMLGGPSAEREVSLRSGQAVAEALRQSDYNISTVDPVSPDWELPSSTDVVFLALHGTYGEDGTVQQRLEELGIPYTGCDSVASRVAFNKVATKRRLIESDLPTPCFDVFRSKGCPLPTGWVPPVILKPVSQGSSVGLELVEQAEEWGEALARVLELDNEALLEERVVGSEVTVGVLKDQTLPTVEVVPKNRRYDYYSKYTSGASEYFCPARFSQELLERAQAIARRAFEAVGGRDFARIDMIVAEDGSPYVLEVNTLPGMTETSLLPKAAAAAGIDFPALCRQMVEMAWNRRAKGAEQDRG